jgi:hypothetical protein
MEICFNISFHVNSLGRFIKSFFYNIHNQIEGSIHDWGTKKDFKGWVQSQSNELKNMLGNCQNSIKIIILLDIFLWCHFNAMLIMECSVK